MGPKHAAHETCKTTVDEDSDEGQRPDPTLARNGYQLLSHPDDRKYLTAVLCFLRMQIEVFTATAEDRDSVTARGGYRNHIDVGRVGIRCVHCACAARASAAERETRSQNEPGSVSYPKSVRLVHQAVRNWQRYHLLTCRNIPEEVKKEYLAVKESTSNRRSHCTSARYWEESCRNMGLVDSENTIRLRDSPLEVNKGSNDGGCPLEAGNSGEDQQSAGEAFAAVAASTPLFRSENVSEMKNVPASLLSKNEDQEAQKWRAMPTITEPRQDQPQSQANWSAVRVALSKDAILEKVKLAHNIVQAARDIRQLSPRCTSPASAVEGDSGGGNLRWLGMELYELFSGDDMIEQASEEEVDYCDNRIPSDNDSSSGLQQQQGKKRGKGPAMQEELVKLRELGLPTALCNLVSALLSSKIRTADDDGYNTVEEVEEDLFLMITQPDRFLFDLASMGGPEQHQQLVFHHDMLYGRSAEVAKLLEAYDKTVSPNERNGDNQVVLISGYSGTGKSSIVGKARGLFTERGACFISAKFDAMCQVQPLSAIVSALNEYCDLLARDTDRIDQVRNDMQDAIGSEVRVLANLVPNLRKIVNIADDVSLMQISGPDAMQRLIFLFRMIFRVTCSPTNPVVLFLDDLQWADEVSLQLMHILVVDTQVKGLLFLGCYRDNEIMKDHPLMVRLRSMQCSGSVSVSSIHITNLDRDSINALVSDTLHLTPRATQSLSEVVLHKTGGNALFVVQFLVSLCDSCLLYYSLPARRWKWDLAGIRAREIADNVVELMTAKLLSLKPEVLEALRIAAAFGAQCQKDILDIIDRDPGRVGNTARALDLAVAAGIMSTVNEGSAHRFSHDQIQNAAYQLIPKSERAAFHLNVGRSLWQHSSSGEMETELFVIVDQLHRGASEISDQEERINLAQLSLMAGQKASKMSAFLSASVYFKSGTLMIKDDYWEHHRELCLDLYNSCAEMEYILGDFESMQDHLHHILQMKRTVKENLRAYKTLIQCLGAQGNTADSLQTAITVLDHLGEWLPSAVDKGTILQELCSTQDLLRGKSEDELFRLETMHDIEKREAMWFYDILALYVFTQKKEYFPVLSCRMVRLSLSHGVCKESAVAFATFGMVLCSLVQDFAGGFRFGKLALSVLDRFQAKDIVARVSSCVYGCINGWSEPLQLCLEPLCNAVDTGLANGDTTYAMLCAHLHTVAALWSGFPLESLMEKMRTYSKQMEECNQQLVNSLNMVNRQVILNLLGRSVNPIKLVGEEMDEDILLATSEDSQVMKTRICFFRMWLEYLFGEHQLAAETAEEIRYVEKQGMSKPELLINYVYYNGLNAIALARQEGREKWAGTIERAFQRVSVWAASSPWNFQHKLELLRAENAFLEGEVSVAVEAYDSAAALAAERHFIHEQAIALERAGIFYLGCSDHAAASRCFMKCRDCYTNWGAHSKAAHVKENYF